MVTRFNTLLKESNGVTWVGGGYVIRYRKWYPVKVEEMSDLDDWLLFWTGLEYKSINFKFYIYHTFETSYHFKRAHD